MTDRPPEVWGTCAVNDHQRPAAFVRELLLFDRLVVPYPDTDEERARWQDPNPADPLETWDPDGLDDLLRVLGTQHQLGHKGARCAWTAPWSQARWHAGRTRREVADIVAEDTFASTRRILAMGDDLPKRVEVIASYPNDKAWWQETQPTPVPPAPPTAASALVVLARPLLLPRIDAGKHAQILRQAVELASSGSFRVARTEYHQLVRRYVGPLQSPDNAAVGDVSEADLIYAREKLLEAEKQALAKAGISGWTVTEWAMMIVGTLAQAGLAAAGALPALGASGPVAQFGGFVAGKLGKRNKDRPLNGASMFVAVDKTLG